MTFSPKNKSSNSRRPIGVDLFAGAGGLSLGFEQAGFDVVASVEIDPIHCAVHEFNFPNCTTICADASRITGAEIRKRARLGHERIDVVFGGAPCQGFSLIGKRALDDPRNGLLHHFVRLVDELEADYFVFENVKGLTIGDHKKLLQELIELFKDKKYLVVDPYCVLNAAEFGVPQDRKRLFLLGAKKGLPLPHYPQTGLHRTTVWEAIGDLPNADLYPELIDSDMIETAKYGEPSKYAKALRGQTVDDRDFSYPRTWSDKRLTSSMRTAHTPLSQSRFTATAHGKVEAISRFLKLHPDGLCNTLRAGTGSDRGAFTSPRPIHPHEPRVITVREAARLHSYPDWFRLHSTKWHGFRQIGNSVPPLLGRAVAAELVTAMGIDPVRPAQRLALGSEELLTMKMNDAVIHFEVSDYVPGKRIRVSQEQDRETVGARSA